MNYSCNITPVNFKLLHPGKPFPQPSEGVYYWHISNFTPDMDKFKVVLALERVMNIWQRAIDSIEPIGPMISFESTKDISKAHFIFTFGSGTHKFPDQTGKIHHCPFPFDGRGGVLAHAWSAITIPPYGGQMHLDEAEHWGDMHHDGRMTHLLTVVLHEMGHIFDLDHSKISRAVMYPTYNGVKTRLHNDDIKGLTKKFRPIKQGISPNRVEESKSWLKKIQDFFKF